MLHISLKVYDMNTQHAGASSCRMCHLPCSPAKRMIAKFNDYSRVRANEMHTTCACKRTSACLCSYRDVLYSFGLCEAQAGQARMTFFRCINTYFALTYHTVLFMRAFVLVLSIKRTHRLA